jgi:phosphoglycerol transferase MdoB-like AlkP superfamily enzyme
MLLQADITLLSSVDESIKSLFTLKDLIYLFDLPILAALLIFIIKKGVTPINIKTRLVRSGVLLLVGLMCVTGVYRASNMGSPVYSNNYVTKTMGVFYFHVDNTKRFFQNQFESKGLTKKDKEKIKDYFKGETAPAQNFRGIARGKNLIVVQVEALQEFVINRKIMGKEITPNLNKLLKDSLFFNNYYYQVAGGNTSDAEFLSNTSLYPLKEGSAFYRKADNFYYSLPKTLKQQGYDTYALHAFGAKFYNRQQMYNSLGFDKFINGEAFKMDDFAGWKGNALSDSSFFRQSLDIIDTSRPFYSFFITLSSHHPYVYFKDFDFNVGQYQGTYLGNYLKAINYTDKCLGEFINNLKRRGLYDKSLLMIYGDHSAIPKVVSEDFMKFLNKENNDAEWIKLQKVPLIIRYPGLRNGQVDPLTGGEIDLLPTIANLMGFDYKYALGKDLLNTGKGYAVLRNGTVVTDKYCYLNDLGGVYSLKTDEKLNKSKYQKEIDRLTKGLDISDLILDKNGLAGLK